MTTKKKKAKVRPTRSYRAFLAERYPGHVDAAVTATIKCSVNGAAGGRMTAMAYGEREAGADDPKPKPDTVVIQLTSSEGTDLRASIPVRRFAEFAGAVLGTFEGRDGESGCRGCRR